MNKKAIIFLSLFLSFVLIFCSISPVVEMSEDISEKVFRLHIIANSNSIEDQNLKLEVRNEIMKASKPIYENCTNINDAIINTEKNIKKFTDSAVQTLKRKGCGYSVRCYVTKEFFNIRKYEGFSLPAGMYNCLKIVIGEGKGRNWWCVMFPQICLSGCTDDFDSYLTNEEKDMITSGGYKVKFKIAEIYERIKAKISG